VFLVTIGHNHKNLHTTRLFIAFLGAVALGLSSLTLSAQSIKSIERALEKQKYYKVAKKLDKKLKKDSLDVGGLYLSARYVFDTASPAYSLDAARVYIVKALEQYFRLDGKDVMKLAKSGVSDIQIELLKYRIDSTGFARAEDRHTEEAYQYFIDRFDPSLQLPKAIALRDSIAFAKASRLHTFEAYQQFLEKYPEARQAEEARARFYKLQFEAKTGGSSIESYAQFIANHPQSPYRAEAESKLYELFTADNKPSTYERFLDRYPNNQYADRAWVWLWFLSKDKENFLKNYPSFPDKQFVENYLETKDLQYFAFYEPATQGFGFMDTKGRVRLAPDFESVMEDYNCEGVLQDFMVVFRDEKAAAYNKMGNQITSFEYEEIEPFSPGVLRTEKNKQYGLVQKGGFTIIPNKYEGLEYLSPSLIKVRQNGKWGIRTFNDRPILPAEYIFIETDSDGAVIRISNGRKYAFTNEANLLQALTNPAAANIELVYDDYELNHNQYLNLVKGDNYLVKDFDGRTIVPQADYIRETPLGWIAQKGDGYSIYDLEGRRIAPVAYQDVVVGRKGYGVKYADQWGVIDPNGKLFVQHAYDTLYFIGETGILLVKGDTKQGYFYKNELTDFSEYSSLEVQIATFYDESSTPEDVPFIITQDRRGREGLLTGSGMKILDNRYSQVDLSEEETIVVSLYGKRGLMNLRGKTVLKPAYEGITHYEDGYFSLLKNKKFGLYDKVHDEVIDPQYDALLKLYGHTDSIFIAKKGKFGLINRKNEPITEFIFEEIRDWNDSVMLVKHNSRWKLYDFIHSYFVPEVFDTFEYLKNDPSNVVLITYRSSGYGLLSSQKGRLIPEEYSDIINLGTLQKPFYLVEREIVQAGKYVLLYIDEQGKVIKDQVLDEPDYIKIACYD